MAHSCKAAPSSKPAIFLEVCVGTNQHDWYSSGKITGSIDPKVPEFYFAFCVYVQYVMRCELKKLTPLGNLIFQPKYSDNILLLDL